MNHELIIVDAGFIFIMSIHNINYHTGLDQSVAG